LGSALTLAALGCNEPTAPPRLGELEPGPGAEVQLARVDDERVALATVERIAKAQGISIDEALRLAIFDALCAREARARDLDRASSFEIATHLARRVLDEELQRARDQGPLTVAELRAFAAENRLEVARPEVVVVAHALLPLSSEATPAEVASVERRADAVAARMRAAASAASGSLAPNYTPRPGLSLARLPKDPALGELEAAARAVEGPSVTFEQLPPLARDGTTVVDDAITTMDSTFTAAAFGLARRGDVGGPTRSQFGFHVIVLLDRIAGQQLSDDELVRAYSETMLGARARRELERSLKDLRASTLVELDPAVDEALARVEAKGSQ
jgi:hypothetical protein